MTFLTKIKFTAGDLAGQYGYEETPSLGSSTLLHLYDEDGEQLDGGNGYFPQAEWEALPRPESCKMIDDSDDFWRAIAEMRSLSA